VNGAMCLRMPPCAFVCHMEFFWTRLRFDLKAHPMVGSWRLGSRPCEHTLHGREAVRAHYMEGS